MPTSHPSMSLLALSKASFLCPGHPDTADGSSSFCITRQTMPSNTGNCLSLPSLSQSSAPHLSQSCSDGEGMSLSPGATGLEGGSAGSWILRVIEGRRWGWVSRGSIPQEGAGRAQVITGLRRACGSNLREEQRERDKGLILAQIQHPHPKLAHQSWYLRERVRAGVLHLLLPAPELSFFGLGSRLSSARQLSRSAA